MNIAKPVGKQSFSPEAEIIRQLQKDEGKIPCYATPVSSLCNRKDCGLRHDCFEEARKLKQQSQGTLSDGISASRKLP